MKNLAPGVGTSSPRQLFYLLYEFACKVCVRYTSIKDNPENRVYEGFARFFSDKEFQKTKNFDAMKDKLKKILINICIKKESRLRPEMADGYKLDCTHCGDSTIYSFLSSQQVIDVLREMPFLLRAVYNMSVIDGFSDQAISIALNIPVSFIPPYLSQVRCRMKEVFQNTELIKAT